MARKKSISTIEAELSKAKSELSKLQEKEEILTARILELQKLKREYEANEIMEAYLKSGKSYKELMTFLQA